MPGENFDAGRFEVGFSNPSKLGRQSLWVNEGFPSMAQLFPDEKSVGLV